MISEFVAHSLLPELGLHTHRNASNSFILILINRFVHGPKVFEECFEQPLSVCQVLAPHHFADAVHGQLRHADVSCSYPGVF